MKHFGTGLCRGDTLIQIKETGAKNFRFFFFKVKFRKYAKYSFILAYQVSEHCNQ